MGLQLSNPPALILAIVLIPVLYSLWRHSMAFLPGRRRAVSLAVRLGIGFALVVAIAGPRLAQHLDRVSVVFLVDVSDSIAAESKKHSVDFIREAIKAMGPHDRAGIVVFGENALVEMPLGKPRELSDLSSIPVTTHTDQ